MNSGPGGQNLSLDQMMQRLGITPQQMAAVHAQMNAGPTSGTPAGSALPPTMAGSPNMMKMQSVADTGPGAVPGNTGGTPFENATPSSNGRLTGPGTPSTGTTPLQGGGATPPPAAPAAPAAWQYQLGNGQSWSPSNQQQVADAQQMVGHNNAVAVPPSNFARWSNYQPFQGLNTKVVPLQGQGQGQGGLLGGQGGQAAGGLLGGVPGIPNMTVSHSAPGSLIPSGSTPGTGVPAGGSGSPSAPVNPAGQSADQLRNYYQQSYGGANQGNGNYSLNGFRFSDSAAQNNPMAAQFNQLVSQGKVNQAYSMLVNDNTGVGGLMLKSAFAGAPDPSTVHQIMNQFAQGGTNAYFGQGVGYQGGQHTSLGGFDANGNFVAPGSPLVGTKAYAAIHGSGAK